MQRVTFTVKMNGQPDINYAYVRVASWLAWEAYGDFDLTLDRVTGSARFRRDRADTYAIITAEITTDDTLPREVEL